MESSWGKEAMKFARSEIPALLSEYKGKPDGFFAALDKRWGERMKLLGKRIEKLPQGDVPKGKPKKDAKPAKSSGDTDGPKK